MHPFFKTAPVLACKKKTSDQIVQRVRHHTPLREAERLSIDKSSDHAATSHCLLYFLFVFIILFFLLSVCRFVTARTARDAKSAPLRSYFTDKAVS
jgi:hypothetical protein